MPVDIKNVLVCDAVDESCIQLLKQNGIKVISFFIYSSVWDGFIYLLFYRTLTQNTQDVSKVYCWRRGKTHQFCTHFRMIRRKQNHKSTGFHAIFFSVFENKWRMQNLNLFLIMKWCCCWFSCIQQVVCCWLFFARTSVSAPLSCACVCVWVRKRFSFILNVFKMNFFRQRMTLRIIKGLISCRLIINWNYRRNNSALKWRYYYIIIIFLINSNNFFFTSF